MIKKYATHYEIEQYQKGDYPALEKMLSIWDDKTFKYTEYYHYDSDNQILYIPSGINEMVLKQMTGDVIDKCFDPNPRQKISFNMTLDPRDVSQKQAIRFLIGNGEYAYTKTSNQLVLSLPGGGGKTYCMIASLSLLNTKGIVIVHNDEIRKQWVARIKQYTNIPDESIVSLSSSSVLRGFVESKRARPLSKHVIYIVTHRLLANYMKRYGFGSLNEAFIKLGIGVKVVDEAHKEYKSTLMIDYATNVWKSYYLTATFIRSDGKENQVFQNSFNTLYKLILSDEEIGHDRNVYYIANVIKSSICAVEALAMKVRGTFNIQKYFECEMMYGELFDAVRFWLDWYYNKKGFTGKAFLLSSKKDSCDLCNNIASELFPDKKVTVHYSGSKVPNLMDYDIVSATDKMLGTGIDLGGLELIINLVPISSKGNIDQIIHRLMRGNSNDTAYYIEVIDASVPHTVDMYRRRSKVIRQIVKGAFVFKNK